MALAYGATRSDYKKDRYWSDQFIPDIKKILYQNAIYFLNIKIANLENDAKKATDLVIKVKGGDVAIRIRRDGYKKKYRDWTIRSHRSNGVKTELAKLRGGFAKWYLYLWTESNRIADWILIDLDKVREQRLLDIKRYQIPNGDGTYFVGIGIPELKRAGCLVAERNPSSTQTDPGSNRQDEADDEPDQLILL